MAQQKTLIDLSAQEAALGHSRKSADYMAQAVTSMAKSLWKDHPDLLEARLRLAILDVKSKNTEGALRQWKLIIQDASPTNRIETNLLIKVLSRCADDMPPLLVSQYALAIDQREAQDRRNGNGSVANPYTLAASGLLAAKAARLVQAKHYTTAKEYFIAALDLRRNCKPQASEVGMWWQQYAELQLYYLHKPLEAIAALEESLTIARKHDDPSNCDVTVRTYLMALAKSEYHDSWGALTLCSKALTLGAEKEAGVKSAHGPGSAAALARVQQINRLSHELANRIGGGVVPP